MTTNIINLRQMWLVANTQEFNHMSYGSSDNIVTIRLQKLIAPPVNERQTTDGTLYEAVHTAEQFYSEARLLNTAPPPLIVPRYQVPIRNATSRSLLTP